MEQNTYYFTSRATRKLTGIRKSPATLAEHIPGPTKPCSAELAGIAFAFTARRTNTIVLLAAWASPKGTPRDEFAYANSLCGVPARHELTSQSDVSLAGCPWVHQRWTRTRPSHSLAAAYLTAQRAVNAAGAVRRVTVIAIGRRRPAIATFYSSRNESLRDVVNLLT